MSRAAEQRKHQIDVSKGKGMMRINKLSLSAILLILPAMGLSVAAQQSLSLIISGRSGFAKVQQIDGRNYVEVEALARLTSSSVSFQGNQIVLTLPIATSDAPVSAPPTAGFSKEFVTAGIEAMSRIREWRAAMKNAIKQSYSLTESWHTSERAQAQQTLRLVSLAVSTTSDKNVFPFLTAEFNNMTALSNKYLQMSLARAYIDPNSIDSDPIDMKIAACAHSLASMATANQFVDDGACQ
jgi:hypothetical protein